MRAFSLLVLGTAVLLSVVTALPAGAPAGPVPLIGLLAGGSAGATAVVREAMVGGLRDLGYREGESVRFVERYADGEFGRLAGLAAELVRLKVDVILTSTTPAALAAKRATTTIPIVVVSSGDLVGAGIVANLARPGGNVTGLSFLGTELALKQLEVLNQIVPAARRIAFLASGAIEPEVLFFKAMEQAAPRLGMSLKFMDAKAPAEYEAAFGVMQRDHAEGLIVAPNLINLEYRATITALAAKAQLPAVYQSREFSDSGGLVSYGINRPKFFRRAASHVDKILKGAKPGDLPIEQPTDFELVINARTAKGLGVTIPQALLLRADEVIQ
jgi:putative ABC transport system substrate-binding protein